MPFTGFRGHLSGAVSGCDPGVCCAGASRDACRSAQGSALRISAWATGNLTLPGPILTPIIERTGMPKEEMEQSLRQLIGAVPTKRMGRPEEVASVVAFLASSQASLFTGEEINADGGRGKSEP